MEEEMGREYKVESRRGVDCDYLTHWPGDAAKLTAHRLRWEGRRERGISSNSREEKTGRLTEWGSEGLQEPEIIPANRLAQSSTCVCVCVVCVPALVASSWFCNLQISPNAEVKDAAWWMLSTVHVAQITPVPVCMHASERFTMLRVRRWAGMWGVGAVKGREIGHGAPLKPCAANQLQLVPHPYKDSLMWARPLNSTLGSHKAAPALIWVRRNLLLFLLDSNKTSACLKKRWRWCQQQASLLTYFVCISHLIFSLLLNFALQKSPLVQCVLSPRA